MAKIQITESELKQIIRESVEAVLKEENVWDGRPEPSSANREPIAPAPKKHPLKIQDDGPKDLDKKKLPVGKPAMKNPINHLKNTDANGKLPTEKPEIKY